MIVEHTENEDKILPTVMEIPSKDQAYDPTKDSMMISAASKLYGYEAGMEKLKDIWDQKLCALKIENNPK